MTNSGELLIGVNRDELDMHPSPYVLVGNVTEINFGMVYTEICIGTDMEKYSFVLSNVLLVRGASIPDLGAVIVVDAAIHASNGRVDSKPLSVHMFDGFVQNASGDYRLKRGDRVWYSHANWQDEFGDSFRKPETVVLGEIEVGHE